MENTDLYCQELRTSPQPGIGKILVTGATGYVGGRLIPELLARGYDVRVMVRAFSPELRERWSGVEIVVGDALDPDSLIPALKGIHTAYYLIHSLLGGNKWFEHMDIQAAENFRKAADLNNVSRIIYLGALGDLHARLSKHLRSRQDVCRELKRGGASVTTLRAAIIIGSGSASFEVMKHLVQRLPVIFLPSWSMTRCQPIAIRNVVAYLVGVLESPQTADKSYDIGGPDILNYYEMLHVFTEILNLRRFYIRLPIHNIRLYSYIISLITPVANPIVFSLLESAVNTVICDNNDILDIVVLKLLSYREAVLRALSREDQDRIHTRWSDAYPPAHELAMKFSETDQSKLFIKKVSLDSGKPTADLFDSICRIGGKEGWFNMNWLWKLRGILDKLLMGVGTSRGRRHSRLLRVNDVVDFWRVEDIVPGQRLLLRAEMKLPGRAWLEFSIDPNHDGTNKLSVIAYYQPFGFWGNAYWYVCLPFHSIIFRDLIEQIERRTPDRHTGN